MVALTISTLILYCRMRVLLANRGLSRESRLLRCFYIVFSVAYMTRVAANWTEQLISSGFLTEIEYDLLVLFWDAVPIVMLSIFHY